jgi:hypothetical protein
MSAVENIGALSVKGFKSFADEQRLEIRPLTLLAGANSSGKSSALQPLLLLKQTLEHSFDPGPLLLDGPHVRFTSASQLLTRSGGRQAREEFEVSIAVGNQRLKDVFRRRADEKLDLARMTYSVGLRTLTLEPGMSGAQIVETGVGGLLQGLDGTVIRNRCFLGLAPEGSISSGIPMLPRTDDFDRVLRSILHVPGLRGNPLRTYPTTDVGRYFQGTFENYAASIIAAWQQSDDVRLNRLSDALCRLGLTWRIRANPVDATRVELLVGRLPRQKNGKDDVVNIADVGFGVSQVVPVLVALLAAEPGQLIYLEQPELHLHPRAQRELASLLAEAAERGARIVAETHSSILLLAVQTLVAQGKLAADLVQLHWFTRDASGATQVSSGELDRMGAYGDWPEDFGEVQMEADDRYLTAVESAALGTRKHARKKADRG